VDNFEPEIYRRLRREQSYPQGSDPKATAVPKKSKRAKRQPKPYWERAFRGHAYWLGKAKLGRVTLEAGHYHWEAAGRHGQAETLQQARTAVEVAVALSDKQLPLFD